MDLEMTGLDPVRHVIVEIATLITDDDLRPIAEGPDIVIAATAEQLGETGWCRAQHAPALRFACGDPGLADLASRGWQADT